MIHTSLNKILLVLKKGNQRQNIIALPCWNQLIPLNNSVEVCNSDTGAPDTQLGWSGVRVSRTDSSPFIYLIRF